MILICLKMIFICFRKAAYSKLPLLSVFIIITRIANSQIDIIHCILQMQVESQRMGQNTITDDIGITPLQSFLKFQSSNIGQSDNHVFVKVMIGKYFIQGHRIFKMLPESSSMILFKKEAGKTHYKFVCMMKNFCQLQSDFLILLGKINSAITKMKQLIQKMIKRPVQNYSVCMAFILQMRTLTFQSAAQFQAFNQLQNVQSKIEILSGNLAAMPFNSSLQSKTKLHSFIPKLTKQHEELLFQSTRQFEELKCLISTYIDTFANQQKANHIYKQMQKSSVSFSVDMLLNTVNFIIYEQLKSSMYSQIESAYWTCFQSKTRTLHQDRKHLVLSGNGQICILEMIFMRQLKSQKEKKTQYLDILAQCKKFNKKAKIKLYRITNKEWSGEVERICLQQQQQAKEAQLKQDKKQGQPIIYKFDSIVVCEHPNVCA